MGREYPEQFDDPVLKGAIKRLYGGQKAPERLRRRIEQLMAARQLNQSTGHPLEDGGKTLSLRSSGQHSLSKLLARRGGSHFLMGLAAAAILLIAAGLSFRLGLWRAPVSPSLDQAMLTAMVETHDRCCRGDQHHAMSVSKESLAAAGRSLGKELGQSVLAANLMDDGWTFRGASICPVGDRKTAHLLFDRNGQTLSVYSVKLSGKLSDGQEHELLLKGHPVVYLVAGDELYCMVGHCAQGKLQMTELASLLQSHLSDIVPPAAAVAWVGPARQGR